MTRRTAFTVEKGIPIPEAKRPRRWTKYPFNKMVIGDSFYVPNYYRDKMQRISAAGRQYYAKMQRELTVCARQEGEGFRIWVIKIPKK